MNILGWHNNAYKWDYNFFISDSFLEANFLTKEIVTIVNVFHNKHKMSLKVLLANQMLFCAGRKQKLSGFVCAYHPAVPGSNPMHTINACSIYVQILNSICHCVE